MRVIDFCMVGILLLLSGWTSSALAVAVGHNALAKQAAFYFDPLPDKAPSIDLIDNFEEKVILGQRLFFDPRLSLSQTVSCHSCHNLATGGADGLSVSVGHGGQTGARNSPTVFNSVLQIAQFWDGRARDLVEQVGGPIVSSIEMASTDPLVCAVLSSMPEYVAEFGAAFPQRKKPICFSTTKLALAAYVSTLLTPDSPFDRYLQGDEHALNEDQQAGLQQFIALGCVQCHTSVNVGGNSYYRFGAAHEPEPRYRPAEDVGRSAVMDMVTQAYVFKVPTLRNVELTAPYFHAGGAWTLSEAIKVMGWTQLDKKLSAKQCKHLEVFLHSLTGKLPQLQVPKLPAATERTPRPQ